MDNHGKAFGKRCCFYIAKSSPMRSPTDPYFGLPNYLVDKVGIVGFWGDDRRQPAFASKCLNVIKHGSRLRNLPAVLTKALLEVQRQRPDFVLCGIDEFSLLLAWLTTKWLGVPFWAIAEDPPFTDRYGLRDKFLRGIERKLRIALTSWLIKQSRGVFCFIDRRALDEVTPVSLRNSAFLIQLSTGTSVEARKLREKLQEERAHDDGVLKIGYVGEVSEEQGIFDLLNAFIRVRRNVPAELYLIGNVAHDWQSTFREFLLQHQIQASVHLVGWVPYEKMLELISKMDVCCHTRKTSRWAESAFPLKICDYLGMNRPVVSWDYLGCRALLRGGDFGALIRYPSIEAFGDALLEFAARDYRQGFVERIEQAQTALMAEGFYEQIFKICCQNGEASSQDLSGNRCN